MGQLGAAINTANSSPDPDTITLTADITLTGNLPPILSPVTIEGQGHFVSGAHLTRVFWVSSTGNLALHEVTVQDGQIGLVDLSGAGIYNDGGTVTIMDSTLKDNSAVFEDFIKNGGGLYNGSGGTVTIMTSTLSGNSANDSGGGIVNSGTLTITNSTLSGNTAGTGGGLYNLGTVTITNSTLSGNSAGSSGGIYSGSGSMYLAGNLFQHGTSGGNCGGALQDNGYNLSSDASCGFSATGSLNNVTLNLGALSGGGPGQQVRTPVYPSAAIFAIPNGVTVNNQGVTLACNGSTTDQLGATRPIETGDPCTSGAVEVSLCPTPNAISDPAELAECIAWANATSGADTLSLAANITLSEPLPNISSEISIEGAGYYISGDDTRRVFYVDAAGNLALHEVTVQHGHGSEGGGIYNDGGTLSVINSTLLGNSANNGGGIYNDSGTVTITTSTLSGNSVPGGNGGGIINSGGTVTITTSTLSGNSAFWGGGFYNASGTPAIVTSSTLSNNTAAVAGGAIFNWSTVNLAGTILQHGASAGNCANAGGATVQDNGYNLSSDASCGFSGTSQNSVLLNLGPLAHKDGGSAQTHRPEAGSAAIGAIPFRTIVNNTGLTLACNGSTTDQNGIPRPRVAGGSCTSGAVEAMPPLKPPVLVAPGDRTNTAATRPTFSWSKPAGATRYRLQIDQDMNFYGPATYAVTTLSYTLPTRWPYGVYYWRVQAGNDADQWSDWSLTRILTITILSTPPNARHLTVTMPTFTWIAAAGATNYHLEVYDDAGLTHPVFVKDTTRISATPSTALAYGQHWWQVRVDRAGGLHELTPVWTLTITTVLPAAPVLTTPRGAWLTNDNTPDFAWDPTPTTAGSPFVYQIQIDNNSTFASPEQDVRQAGRTYTAAPLPDKVYYWRVRAINNVDAAGSWSAARSFTVDTTPPVAPKLLTPANWSGTTNTRPTFTWGAVSGAKRYTLAIFTGVDCTTPRLAVERLTVTTYTLTVAQALPYGNFCWRVQAGDLAENWGSPSGFFHLAVSATALTRPAAPGLDTPENASSWTSVTLPAFTWTLSGAGGNTFQIQIDNQSTFASLEQDALTSVDQTTYTAAPLADGLYSWRVRAVSSAGVAGPWSTARTFRLDNVAPAAPVLMAPASNAHITATRPTLTWQAVTGAKRVLVQLARDAGFTDLVVNKELGSTATSYALTATEVLSHGSTYHWRVQAVDAATNASGWSTAQFTVTVHKTPANGASTTDTTPTFTWAAVAGATYWLQVASSADFITGIVVDRNMNTLTTYTLPSGGPALNYGTHYWRVQMTLGGGSTWMPAWTLIVTPPKPGQTVLLTPASGTLTNNNTPTLSWKAVPYADTYQVQIDNNGTFASPEQDVIVGSGSTSYLTSELADGLYHWRVRAVNSVDAPGAWSYKRTITVDTTPPAVPALIAPADGVSVTNTKLLLSWTAVAGATRYQLQLDPDPAFVQPVVDAGTLTTYKPPTPLSRAVYAWHVRALDNAGNASAWSEDRTFTIVAGVTAPLDPTPTPVPLTEPTAAGTVDLTATSDLSLQFIESDDAQVLQTGSWTAHDTSLASGGRYLYSSGSLGDALTLTFTGSQVDIVYVRHPALGVVVVEVDGAPLQLVDSVAPDSEFGARITVSVSPGQHTLRLYPMTGTVAIDAFAVELQILPLTPTVEPTGEPTQILPSAETPAPVTEPTGEGLATVEPTLPPLPTEEGQPTPTATALPVLLPVVETFDSGTGWLATGAWRFDPQAAYRGGGWLADGALRDQSSTLTSQVQFDLRAALNPELTFWQRASLASADVMAVDLSLDGGLTWFPLDQQVGASFGWSPRTVSLGAYRGAIVALRFRLDTLGMLPEGGTSVSWWIDELLMQDTPIAPPSPVPTELPTGTPTELPTVTPSPTETPTVMPTELPTAIPTEAPTVVPLPTEIPAPTKVSTDVPAEEPLSEVTSAS